MKRIFGLSLFLFTSNLLAITIDDFNTNQAKEYVTSSVPQKSSSVASNGALGGYRSIHTEWISGPRCNGGPAACAHASSHVGESELFHSQDSEVKARMLVTWDGDSTVETFSNSIPSSLVGGGSGFGAIDLTRDGATAIVLPLTSFDFGGGTPVQVLLRVYSSDTLFSDASVDLNSSTLNRDLTFGFNSGSFDAFFVGAADFKSVRAIQLFVTSLELGSGGSDLRFSSIRTNGECSLVPQNSSSGYQIYGDCGFCYDQDQQKNECGLCPQHSLYNNCRDCADEICLLEGRNPQNGECRMVNQPDTCGVCNGDGSSCADCNGVPNGGAKLDLCNVCGGNNSCLDCNGVPFGQSKLDNCGVCNGNNSSCVTCTSIDVSPLLFALDAEAKNQELPIQRMLRELVKYDNRPTNVRLRAKLSAKARELQVRNWVISWTVEGMNTQCVEAGSLALCDFSDLGVGLGDEFGPRSLCLDPNSASQNIPSYCSIRPVNQDQVNEYRLHAEELWRLTEQVAKILNKRKNKVGAFEANKLKRARKAGLNRGSRAYKQALALANRVPLKSVSCTAP